MTIQFSELDGKKFLIANYGKELLTDINDLVLSSNDSFSLQLSQVIGYSLPIQVSEMDGKNLAALLSAGIVNDKVDLAIARAASHTLNFGSWWENVKARLFRIWSYMLCTDGSRLIQKVNQLAAQVFETTYNQMLEQETQRIHTKCYGASEVQPTNPVTLEMVQQAVRGVAEMYSDVVGSDSFTELVTGMSSFATSEKHVVAHHIYQQHYKGHPTITFKIVHDIVCMVAEEEVQPAAFATEVQARCGYYDAVEQVLIQHPELKEKVGAWPLNDKCLVGKIAAQNLTTIDQQFQEAVYQVLMQNSRVQEEPVMELLDIHEVVVSREEAIDSDAFPLFDIPEEEVSTSTERDDLRATAIFNAVLQGEISQAPNGACAYTRWLQSQPWSGAYQIQLVKEADGAVLASLSANEANTCEMCTEQFQAQVKRQLSEKLSQMCVENSEQQHAEKRAARAAERLRRIADNGNSLDEQMQSQQVHNEHHIIT